MVAYKLSKNGWVMPFFVIFRLAREKLLVTVALDHPVFNHQLSSELQYYPTIRITPLQCYGINIAFVQMSSLCNKSFQPFVVKPLNFSQFFTFHHFQKMSPYWLIVCIIVTIEFTKWRARPKVLIRAFLSPAIKASFCSN